MFTVLYALGVFLLASVCIMFLALWCVFLVYVMYVIVEKAEKLLTRR